MDPFSDSLIRNLRDAAGLEPKWEAGVNPLVLIGLTEAWLDLGLSEEQMYKLMRAYIKNLTGQVHPDRKPSNVSKERQQQIQTAFNELDNFENFRRALREFRNAKAEERTELSVVRAQLRSLKLQLSQLESQQSDIAASRAELKCEVDNYERRKSEEPLVVPGLRADLNKARDENVSLSAALKNQKRIATDWRDKFERIMSSFTRLGLENPPNPSATFAYKARWVAVVYLCYSRNPLYTEPFKDEKTLSTFKKQIEFSGLSEKDIQLIKHEWKVAQDKLGTPSPTEVRKLPLALAVFKLSYGIPYLMYGDQYSVGVGRVVGSISQVGGMEVSRTQLVYKIAWEDVIELLTPYLTPGAALVSMGTNMKYRASWSLKCPAFSFTTKRIVLAVG